MFSNTHKFAKLDFYIILLNEEYWLKGPIPSFLVTFTLHHKSKAYDT